METARMSFWKEYEEVGTISAPEVAPDRLRPLGYQSSGLFVVEGDHDQEIIEGLGALWDQIRKGISIGIAHGADRTGLVRKKGLSTG